MEEKILCMFIMYIIMVICFSLIEIGSTILFIKFAKSKGYSKNEVVEMIERKN